MGFGAFLFAFFLPPIFLYSRGKWISGTVSLLCWLIAWALLVTIVFSPVSPIPFLISFLPAAFALRQKGMHEAAGILAERMAAELRQAPPPTT
jgi:hypothetical protein